MPEFAVNTYASAAQWTPSVAMSNDGRFVIAWESQGQDGSGTGVYAQRLDPDGALLGEEFRANLTTDLSQGEPSVAMASDGRFVIAWTSQGQDGSGEGIYGRRYDAKGNPLGDEVRINTITTGDQHRPSVRMRGNGAFVVAWTHRNPDSNEDIHAQRFDAQGTPVGDEVAINTFASGDQTLPSVGMTAGGWWVVAWMSRGQDSDPVGIFAQRYSAQGTPLGRLPW